MIPTIASAVLIATLIPKYQAMIEEAQDLEEEPSSSSPALDVDVDDARYQVEEQTAHLAMVVEEYQSKIGVAPPDTEALYAAWRSLRAGEEEPLDPFDGSNYGYYVTDDGFVIWSSGPDGAAETEDDILKEFPLEQCPDSLLWFTSSTSGTGRTSPARTVRGFIGTQNTLHFLSLWT